ncbi:MAG: hypothetical protein AAF378_15460 [Cyanobacteria bacterium P01_A01_bin.84]
MSNTEIHQYLNTVPEKALQEFAEWCVTEQAKEAGYEFSPHKGKLVNLSPTEYIQQLIDEFMKVKNNPIKDGMAAVFAGKQADNHALSGTPAIVDFISLYVKYLFPQEGNDPQQADELIAKAEEQQLEKLTQIAQKYDTKLSQ